MKIGKYEIGRYPAIIRAVYEDGTIIRETDFDSDIDLLESVNAYVQCIGHECGVDKLVLRTFEVIYDPALIEAELRIAELSTREG